MATKLKGQSAMEYLMTYGWAILIIIIVVAVLFSLGVFNPSTFTQTSATGFAGFNIPSGGWQLSSAGRLTLQIRNSGGSTVNITGFNVTQGTTTATNVTTSEAAGVQYNMMPQLSPGGSSTLYVSGLTGGTAGSSYSLSVTVHYINIDTGLRGFKSSGTLTGSIS